MLKLLYGSEGYKIEGKPIHQFMLLQLRTHLQFALKHNLATVGHDVLALPARDTLLQLAQLV